jgi:RNA polymerase sigma-70 factor (ECF subfamily)
MTDSDLAKGCLEGKREYQLALYKKYAPTMMSVCLRYTDSRNDAEDVMQEGFIKVFERIGQWQNSGPLGGWIRTVMVNTALSNYRSNAKWNQTTDVEEQHHLQAEDISALEHIQADDLMKVISSMPTGYRTVFNLFAVEGYGHKEIGEMLGVTENTSKTQYLKARVWLQKTITRHEAIAGKTYR